MTPSNVMVMGLFFIWLLSMAAMGSRLSDERRARRKLETVDMARFHILDKEVDSALKQLREMGEAKLAWQDRAQVAEAGLNECLWTMSRAYEHLTRYVHRCDGPSNDPWPDPYRARSIATAIKAILDKAQFPFVFKPGGSSGKPKTDETPESGAQP